MVLRKIGFEFDPNETTQSNVTKATMLCMLAINKLSKENKAEKPSDLARTVERLLETGKHEDRDTVRLLMNYDNRFRVR